MLGGGGSDDEDAEEVGEILSPHYRVAVPLIREKWKKAEREKAEEGSLYVCVCLCVCLDVG